MVFTRVVLVLSTAAAGAAALSPLDTFSCQPLVDDVDYERKGLAQTIKRPTPEECCQDCRFHESSCDMFVWTPDNGGECTLQKLAFPLTKIERPGVKSSLIIPCRCTKGEGCDVASEVCNGCMSGGSCLNVTGSPCTHAGGKICNEPVPSTTKAAFAPSTTTTTVTTSAPTSAALPVKSSSSAIYASGAAMLCTIVAMSL